MEKELKNLNIKNLVQTEWINQFNEKQQREIREGLENNLDVSIYAKKEFTWEQMFYIRKGLKNNLDISWYAKKEFDWKQMQIIILGLKDNLDVSSYANEKFTAKQMGEIREQLLAEKYFLI